MWQFSVQSGSQFLLSLVDWVFSRLDHSLVGGKNTAHFYVLDIVLDFFGDFFVVFPMQIPLNVQWDEVNLLLTFASSAANCPFCFLETRWLGLHQAAERGPKPVSNLQAKERKSIQLKRFRISFFFCHLLLSQSSGSWCRSILPMMLVPGHQRCWGHLPT